MFILKRSSRFLTSFFLLMLTACASSPTLTPIQTGTALPATPTSPAPRVIPYRGNPQRTGVFDFPALRHQPAVKWQTKISSTWLMPPILADGVLYSGSGDGYLYALNAETGQEIWRTGGFSQLENSGAVAGDTIVIGGYDSRVRALDRHTGEVLWSFNTVGFVQASPLIVDDHVYIATDRALYALDLPTGQLKWQAKTGDGNSYMGAPAFENGTIYTTGGNYLLALESTTGKEIWRIRHDEPFTALAVANQLVYVGNFDGSFYAYDQETGTERWKFEGGDIFWSGPAVEGDILYTGNDKFVYALNAQTGEQLWSFETGGRAVSEPMVSDGVVYVSDSSHEFPRGARHLYALDAGSGEELWTFETASTFLPAPALGEGTIYVTSTGEVFALHQVTRP